MSLCVTNRLRHCDRKGLDSILALSFRARLTSTTRTLGCRTPKYGLLSSLTKIKMDASGLHFPNFLE